MFVIFYIFTMPFALLSPDLNLQYAQLTIIVFLMTYGFIGIEVLFVELDDPFSEDSNDLPLREEARAAQEDILLNLWHADGKAAVDQMKRKFVDLPHNGGNADGSGAKETDPLV